MKRITSIFLLILTIGTLTACGGQSDGNVIVSGEQAAKMTTPKGDVDTDICKQFDADFIYSATGKPIVKVEPSTLPTVFACSYYTDYKEGFYKEESKNFSAPGGPSVLIVLDNLSVATNKEAVVNYMEGTIHTDDRIPMEHYLTRRKDNSLWDIKLVINPNRFVSIKQSHDALTEEEQIGLAIRMAEMILGKDKLKIKKNPVDTAVPKPEETQAKPESQEATVRTFFDLIGDKKIDDALKMMDANEDTKQMWGVNFNSLESLKIKSINPVYEEDWTATRVSYKVDLETKVKTDEYGWSDGLNPRWITLTNDTGKWLVHELANNP